MAASGILIGRVLPCRLGAVMESNGVLLMERGRVVECGAPMMLARDPQSNISRLLEASKSFNNGVLEY